MPTPAVPTLRQALVDKSDLRRGEVKLEARRDAVQGRDGDERVGHACTYEGGSLSVVITADNLTRVHRQSVDALKTLTQR